MNRPSVIALPIGEAREVLDEAGVGVAATIQTGPPGGPPPGPPRVVRERGTEEGVELVVAASVTLSGEEDNDD
jgi:hypothetical protein